MNSSDEEDVPIAPPPLPPPEEKKKPEDAPAEITLKGASHQGCVMLDMCNKTKTWWITHMVTQEVCKVGVGTYTLIFNEAGRGAVVDLAIEGGDAFHLVEDLF